MIEGSGSRRGRRAACGLTLMLLLGGCAMTPPAEREGAAPVPSHVLSRFQLADEPSGALTSREEAAGVPLLGGASGSAEGRSDEAPLQLEHVLRSVESQFPLILAAMEQVEIAAGEVESSQGAFDTKLKGKGDFEREGFYENDAYDVSLEQPTTLWGTTFVGGYRRGVGDFAVYDGKQKTNERGEFRAGVLVPLLQGGRIDPERVAMWQARLAEEQAWPQIEGKRLAATRKAAESYWKWVANGARRHIAAGLLELAERRQAQLQVAVGEGELAPIALIDNERLIVDRAAKLVSAEQKLQQAAIELSLYWRDESGEPVVAGPGALPVDFPAPRPLEDVLVPDDVGVALARRPELREVALEIEQLQFDVELAENQMLADLDLGLFGSKDQGNAANTPDDKGEFELEAMLRFELPLQRRKPRGARRKADAKVAKLEQERRFLQDVIVSEVRDSVTTLTQTWERLDQARRNVELARLLEEAERVQLSAGESDLLRVNLRESQTAVAAANLIDVIADHFVALAGYRAVLGLPYDEVLAGSPVGGVTQGP